MVAAARPPAQRRKFGARDVASYGAIIGAVWLGWQVALQPLVQRAPVDLVIGLAPTSPTVLRRAAESELAAGRIDNAAELSRDALLRSPFDIRALRVFGLSEARAGREDTADEILTLAGNWSLRDDPAHAWLVERRLRRGDYASSFAHADTLVRRREDIQPQVFRLFTAAGTEDPQRSLPVITRLMAASPPWRSAYLDSLRQTPQELQLAANLAVLLEASDAPLINEELQELYWALMRQGQFPALSAVRGRLGRPPNNNGVTNGEFADDSAPQPFQWRLYPNAGIVPEIVADDRRPSNPALRVGYDGYAAGTIVEQLISLSPGQYIFSAEVLSESGDPGARLAWTVSCAPRENAKTTIPAGPGASGAWAPIAGRFEVPKNCPVQWLRLETRAGDRRSQVMVWYDRIRISSAS